MLQRTKIIFIACLLTFGLAVAAHAEFTLVSGFQPNQNPAADSVAPGGAPNDVARSLANGFPLWYQDTATALKIAPCLDFGPIIDVPPTMTDLGELATLSAVNAYCFGEAIFLNPAQPVSFNGGAFPENFPELFGYYVLGAEAAGNFSGDPLLPGLILVEMGLHGGFVSETPIDGEQIMIADTFVRLRGLPPADNYTLETPYATYTFNVLGPDVRFTHTVNTLIGGDFLSVMGVAGAATAVRDVANLQTSSNAPVVPTIFDDLDEFAQWPNASLLAYNTAFQAAFAAPPATPGVDGLLDRIFRPILNAAGLPSGAEQLYLAVGQAEAPVEPPPAGFTAPAEQPVTLGGLAQTITLTAPVAIEPTAINPLGDIDGNGILTDIVISGFSLQGKIFNEGANVEPATVADVGFASATGSSLIVVPGGATLDVTANDTDDPSPTNVHGIHPGSALAMAWEGDARLGTAITAYSELPSDGLGNLLLASSVATERGGTVRRAIDRATGKMQFLYTPPAPGIGGQVGVDPDRFMYVIQDRGGLISLVTPVTVTVEAVNMTAQYRTKNGRWTISGNSSITAGNNIDIFNGPTIGAGATPIKTIAVDAATGAWKFEGKLPISPDGTLSCRTANGVTILNVAIDIK